MFLWHRTIAVRLARVVLGLDELIFDATGVMERHQPFTETLLRPGLKAMTLQMPCQKLADPTGIDCSTVQIWPVPLRALRPECFIGKQVMSRLTAPVSLP